MNMRSDFTANVTHELKTPLTSIKGFVETLIDGVDDPEQAQHFLKIIATETERLSRLIDDILYLSEIESEKEEAKERINVLECINSTKELLEAEAKDRNIEIFVYDMSDKQAFVLGSKDKVMQMLVNLVTNGIRYNKPGGNVKIMLETVSQEVIISIADSGIGIPKENIPRLFERFYRVDKGRSRAQGGTGLGLAIVKHIVLSMKGNISVQSSLGVGSIFSIRLPRA
jgi:two-component system phosphate regulon sensor histidine kinase PhoR